MEEKLALELVWKRVTIVVMESTPLSKAVNCGLAILAPGR